MADNIEDPTEPGAAPFPEENAAMDSAILNALQAGKPASATVETEVRQLMDRVRGVAQPHVGTTERVRYFGDYLLISELGRGGMGLVYRARQVSLNRDVALKMLLATQFSSRELVTRFRLEAEAAATLDHPHIVPVYEVGEYEQQSYYCMKFIEGRNLSDRKQDWVINAAEKSRADQQARSRRISELLEKIARAMHYAHQRGILHRDLKPSNILIDGVGEPHITDFGLAKLLDAPEGVTVTGAVLGTPSYMAPEQAAGSKVITTAVDVYGLGAILYELLTARPPFKGDSSAHTLRLVLETELKRPRSIIPHLERDLESICLKCLARNAHERYRSADALADDLRRFMRNEPTLARPSSRRERTWKWAQRNPALAGLFAITASAILILVSGLIVSNLLIGRAHQATESALERQQQANYIKTVNLAYRDVQEGDPMRALDMLANCRPERRDWEWNYLKRISESGYRKLSYPGDVCHDLEVTAHGRYIAALVSEANSATPQFTNVKVVLFDGKTRQLQRTLEVPGVALDYPMEFWQPRITSSRGGHFIAFMGTHAADGKKHGVVRCFDGTKDWQPKKLKMDLFRDQVVMGVFFDDKNRLYALTHAFGAANRDEIVDFQVVDVEAGTVKFKFKDRNRQAAPQLNRNCKVLLLAGGNHTLLDFTTGEVLPPGDLQHMHRYIGNTAISSDDKYIASVDNYGRLIIFDFATRKKLREIHAHTDGAYDLVFAGLNKEIVTGGADGIIKRWRISDGELLGKLNTGEMTAALGTIAPSGEVIATDSIGTLALWNPEDTNALRRRDPQEGAYFTKQLSFCEEGSRVFALESTIQLTAWDSHSKEQICSIEFHKFGDSTIPDAMSMTPTKDGRRAAVCRGGLDDPNRLAPMEIWDIDQGKLITQLPLTKSPPLSVVWDDKEQVLAAILKDHSLVALDVRTKKQIWDRQEDHTCWIGRHPKSGQLHVVETHSEQSTSRAAILDMLTGQLQQEFTIAKPALRIHRFSFDGDLLLASVGGTNATNFRDEAAIIDSQTGALIESYFLSSKPDVIVDMHLSANGNRLFAQTHKAELRVWDRCERELVLNLRNYNTPFRSFAFDRNGLAVAGTSTGRGFYLWDGRSFEETATPESTSPAGRQ